MAATITGVFNLIDRASGPLKKIEEQAKKTDAALAMLGDRMDNVGTNKQMKQFQDVGKSLKDIERQTKGNNSSMSTMDRNTRTLGNSTDKLNTKLVRTGLKLKALHMIMTSFKFPVMVAGVGAVAQAVAALGAGLTAMLPQIGQWAGSMVSLLPNLARVSSLSAAAIPSVLGLGSAFLGAKLAFSGFSDAVSQGGAALSKLEPQARRVALTLRGVGKELKENLQATAQSSFFNMLSADRLKKTVFNQNTQQKATKIVGVGATTAGATADNVLTGLTRGGFLGDFLKIARQMQPVIVQLSSSFLNLAHAAMDIGVAAVPIAKWLGETINGWTEWAKVTAQAGRSTGELGRKFDTAMLVADQFGRILTSVWDVLRDVVVASDVAGNSMWDSAEKGVKNWAKWTSSFQGQHSMADWFTHASESASTLWSVVKNVGRGLFAMGGVSRETGDTLWQSLDRVTDKWADWMNSMTGQNEMATYFKNVREPLQVAGSLVAGLVGGFVELGKSRTVTETLRVLTEGIGPLTTSLDKLGTAFGPVLANSLVQILKLFTNLQSEGGAFARVIEMFNSLLEGINAVLDKFSILSTAFSVGIFGLAMQKATAYITRMATAWGLVAKSAGAATVASGTAAVAGGAAGFASPIAGAAGATAGAYSIGTKGSMSATGSLSRAALLQGGGASPGLTSKFAGIGGMAAGAKMAGAAIGKFVWPVMALMAASDFVTAKGGLGNKFQGMISGGTFGLLPGAASPDQLQSQGIGNATASGSRIWKGSTSLGDFRKDQAQLQAQIAAVKGQTANKDWFESATGFLHNNPQAAAAAGPLSIGTAAMGLFGGGEAKDQQRIDAEAAKLAQMTKQNRQMLGKLSLAKGQKTFDNQQAAFAVYRRKLGLVEGSSEMAEMIVQSLSQENLGKKGAKALAQSQLSMFRQMAKNNPKLKGVYEDLSQGIERRLGKMNSNVQIINGKIYDGGAKEWGRLKKRIGSDVEEARQHTNKAFTAIQKQVKRALIIRGFSERQANAMINRNDDKGHGPMSHSADPAPTPGGLSRGGGLGDHRTPEEKAAAAIRIGRRQAADAVPVTGGRSKSIQAFKDEEKQLDHYKKKYAGLKVDLTDKNGKIYRNTTDMFNQTATKVDKAMQRQKESVNTAYASIVQQTKQKLAAIGVTGTDAQSILSSVGLSGGASSSGHGGGGHGGGAAATGMRVNYAGGGRIGGTGNQDKIGVGPGHIAAPGELIVNRHTEADVNRDLISHGKAPLGRRVAGENRPHYMPESHAMGGRITFGTGGRAGQMGTYPGVTGDTDFVPGLGQALSRLSRATGTPITVNSGWRSYSEQAALYASYLAGTGNLAAPPGSSNHEDGMAADISPGSEVFGSMASRFGLGFTVPGESWHIELVDGAAGGPPGGISMGGGGGAAAPKRIRLKAPKVGGSGMTGVMGQLSANMMTGGMNKRINKKLAAMGGGGGVVAGGGGGGSVPAQIYSVLSANGWNKIGAAGVIGNAYAESSFNTGATGYGGGGLWGFTASPNSLADLQAYAQGKGSWTDASLQTRFLLEHVAASTKAHSNRAGSPEAAASVFMNEFERPGIPREDVRQQAARRAFEQGFATGGRVPQFGGWFGDGGSFMAHKPTMIGVGENGSEHVQITPRGKGASGKVGGTNVTIQAIHIENHRSGDVKKAVKKEIEAAFNELERELHNNTGSGMV